MSFCAFTLQKRQKKKTIHVSPLSGIFRREIQTATEYLCAIGDRRLEVLQEALKQTITGGGLLCLFEDICLVS